MDRQQQLMAQACPAAHLIPQKTKAFNNYK
jgi:hypothetical protein